MYVTVQWVEFFLLLRGKWLVPSAKLQSILISSTMQMRSLAGPSYACRHHIYHIIYQLSRHTLSVTSFTLFKYLLQHLSNVIVEFLLCLHSLNPEITNISFWLPVRHCNPESTTPSFRLYLIIYAYAFSVTHSDLSPKYYLNKKNHCVINWDW